MLIGLLAPENVIPTHNLAYITMPTSGVRWAKPRLNLYQAGVPSQHPGTSTVRLPVIALNRMERHRTRMNKINNVVAMEETVTTGAPGMVLEVHSPDEFNGLVAETNSDDTVLVVKYYYKGCSACRAMSPRFEQFAKDYAGKKIRFAEVEVMTNKAIAKENKVRKVPSVQFFVGGKKEEDFMCGPKRVNVLKERLDDYNENGVDAVANSAMDHGEPVDMKGSGTLIS